MSNEVVGMKMQAGRGMQAGPGRRCVMFLLWVVVAAMLPSNTAAAEPTYYFHARTDGLPATGIAGRWDPTAEGATLRVAGAHVASSSRFEARWRSAFTEPRKSASLICDSLALRVDIDKTVRMDTFVRHRCQGCRWSRWLGGGNAFVMPIGITSMDLDPYRASSPKRHSWQFEWKAIGTVDKPAAFFAEVPLIIR